MACFNYTITNDSSEQTQVRYINCNSISSFVYVSIGNSVVVCATEGSVITLSGFSVVQGGTCTTGTPPPAPEPTPPPAPEEETVTVAPSAGAPIVYEQRTVLSRSPFNFKLTSDVLFDNVAIEMYLYTGDKIADRPVLPTYNFTKKVIQAGQTDISIEIHQQINDFISANYEKVTGLSTILNTESIWCYLDAKIFLVDTEIYRVQQQLLGIDGFGYHTELFNPEPQKKVLSDINEHIIYNGSAYRLYFSTSGLTDIIVNGTAVAHSFNPDVSNQAIASIDVTDYKGTDTSFTAQFAYETGLEEHSFTYKEECKYPLINCIFKNRYGFYQKIAFNKLSKKSIDVESSEFKPIISKFGKYNLNSHQKQTYNHQGTEKISVNTDFLPESYNGLFTELFLSNSIYLEENGVALPVNLNKKTLEKKTKLNDKLINYTMDFEYSFNLINQVI